MNLWRNSDGIGAHNTPFDMKIIRIALMRTAPNNQDLWQQWKESNYFCTMRMAKPYTAVHPGTEDWKNRSKMPKLSEALDMLMGQKLENAHSAIYDVKGCMDLYFHLKSLE